MIQSIYSLKHKNEKVMKEKKLKSKCCKLVVHIYTVDLPNFEPDVNKGFSSLQTY